MKGDTQKRSIAKNLVSFCKNIELIYNEYYNLGAGAETIHKNISCSYNVEVLRGQLRKYFVSRTPDQEKVHYSAKTRNRGKHMVCYSLFGAEDEIIRGYKLGRSSCTLSKEFRCSEDTIRSILSEHCVFEDRYYKINVRRHSNNTRVENFMNMPDDEKKKIYDKVRETATRNGSYLISRKKRLEAAKRKYGILDDSIINISQILEVHEKQQRYRYKDYKLPSGKIINVQGYENFALDELLAEMKEDDVCIRKTFWYFNHEKMKNRKYFADIFLPTENKIIEVKSIWTLSKYISKNLSIALHFDSQEYDFEYWVYSPNRSKTIIRNTAELLRFSKSNGIKIPEWLHSLSN